MAMERRMPCPERIIDMAGFAFGVGCCGGFALTFAQSLRHNPAGHRLSGALAAAQTRAPNMGHTFALWSGLFHTFECAVSQRHANPDGARSSADAGMCGFLTAGVLSLRLGPKAASTNAVVGGLMVLFVDAISGSTHRGH